MHKTHEFEKKNNNDCSIRVDCFYCSKQPSCKKKCGPVQNGQCEKSCEIQVGSQEMAVLVGYNGKNCNSNSSGESCAES